jgi:hypothetical protein
MAKHVGEVEISNVADAAEMPERETTETTNDADDTEMLKDGDTVEIVSDTDEGEQKLLCGSLCCEQAILQFYPAYLTYVKKWSPSEVNRKTMSQRRTIEWVNRIIQEFVDAPWSKDAAVTYDGYQLTR